MLSFRKQQVRSRGWEQLATVPPASCNPSPRPRIPALSPRPDSKFPSSAIPLAVLSISYWEIVAAFSRLWGA